MTLPSAPQMFLQQWRTFARLAKEKFLLLPPLMLVAGLFEGIGIVLLLPIIEQLTSASHGAAPSPLHRVLVVLHLDTLPRLLILVTVVFLAKFCITLLQQIAIQRVTRDLYRSLGVRIVHGWTTAEYREFYLQTTTGALTNILTRELWAFVSAFSYFCMFLVGIVYVVVYVTGAFLIEPRVMATATGIGVLVLIVLRRWTGFVGGYSLQLSEAYARLQDHLLEFLQHFKYLKATARFPTMERRLREVIMQTTACHYRIGVTSATMSAIPEPIAMLVLVLFLYGSIVVMGAAFSTTIVLALLLYRTLMRLLALQANWQKVVGCSGSLRAVEQALMTTELHRERQGTLPAMTISHAITFDGVTFAYAPASSGGAARTVMTNVSLRIPARRTVAFVGPSGGGKSTIIDLLTGVLKPTDGRIALDGVDYRTLHLDALRAMVGYVAQEIVMFNDTIANNVAWWSPTDDAVLRRRCADASCDFIEQLPMGFATVVGDRGIALSVGQRQRIAIARELFRDPQLLIFDEATSALDSESEEVIRQHIKRLSGTRTIVLIAHRLSTIRHADYLYVIDGGRVVEEGTFNALYGNPQSAFRAMCDLQRIGATA